MSGAMATWEGVHPSPVPCISAFSAACFYRLYPASHQLRKINFQEDQFQVPWQRGRECTLTVAFSGEASGQVIPAGVSGTGLGLLQAAKQRLGSGAFDAARLRVGCEARGFRIQGLRLQHAITRGICSLVHVAWITFCQLSFPFNR